MTTVWRRPWLQILLAGLVLYIAMERALVATGNVNLVPGVICLGAFLGPIAFVAYVYERAPDVPLPTLLWCFLAGGAVGLAEETSKLLVPLVIFVLWRHRREADGLLFGVAAGMGFAAFETMGYGLTVLIASHGRIDAVEQVLFTRNLLSPAGHAAWTGLICAALWRARLDPRPAAKLALLATFLLAVTLHALWDSATSRWGLIPVALVSWMLLSLRMATVDPAPERSRMVRPPRGVELKGLEPRTSWVRSRQSRP
jgi:protease PrsW